MINRNRSLLFPHIFLLRWIFIIIHYYELCIGFIMSITQIMFDSLRSQPLPLTSALPPGVEENEGCRGGGSRLGGSCWVRLLTSFISVKCKYYHNLNWNYSPNIFPGPAEGSWEQEWEWWKPAQSPRRTLIPSECLFSPVFLYFSLCICISIPF